jgi:ABC-2 type transport system ATP-binding protein
MSSAPHIIVENLAKTYRVAQREPGALGALKGLFRRRHREVRALDGVSFSIEPGELVGYIGPNGAGKSTTVKVLAGILVPDSGVCQVAGRTPWRERMAHVRDIGVVFGQRTQLWWDLPVIESYDLLADIYRIPTADHRRTRDELIERMDLEALLDTPVRQLSLGQRMRCDLVAALLHRPSLLFLDEPTIGLDAVSKLAVREFVQQLNRDQGVTIILTTHAMDDVAALCSRVILINRGQVLLDGPLDDLRRQVATRRRLVIDLAWEEQWIDIEGAEVVKREGPRVHLRYDPAGISTADLVADLSARYAIRDLLVEDQPIEEIVAQLYRSEAT